MHEELGCVSAERRSGRHERAESLDGFVFDVLPLFYQNGDKSRHQVENGRLRRRVVHQKLIYFLITDYFVIVDSLEVGRQLEFRERHQLGTDFETG